MPKNKGKGGKNRRRGKNENDNEKRELIFKEDGQEYAQVVKMLGNGRLEAMCFDGEKRLAHIRGKLRKKVWINQGDIILLSLRDYQDEKGDVILKYTADEARNLKAYGELPENAKINETDTFVSRPRVILGGSKVLTKCAGRPRRRWMGRVRCGGRRRR
ncbi:nucleic acid-binding protein [Ascobolus immersus RN42]|uniref:Eukaryotic translation initiation factor 1A n=1 Tax=Ascobolus immersus RN42 TaxID=1160509 RepID=A0A3N4HYU3_ASCIM|nr:nucleic acid-binding protein [Ascobolus immersus RN42]